MPQLRQAPRRLPDTSFYPPKEAVDKRPWPCEMAPGFAEEKAGGGLSSHLGLVPLLS